MNTNFAEFVFQNQSQNPAYTDSHQTVTYRDLAVRSARFSQLLSSLDIQPRTRVIVSMQDGVDWMTTYFGLMLHGCVQILAHPDSTAADIEKLVSRTKATVAVINGNMTPGSLSVQEITADMIANMPITPNPEIYHFHPDESAVWFTTSGSTGQPKLVMHRHQNLYNYLESLKQCYDIGPGATVFGTPKASFSYGFSLNCVVCPGLGAHAIINDRAITQNSVFDSVNKHQATHLFTNPTILSLLVKKGNGGFGTHLRHVVSASEPLPYTIEQQFKSKYKLDILNGLGWTECVGISLGNTVKIHKSGSIGKPFPGYEFKVVDDQGNAVGPDQVGTLLVNSTATALGYYQDWEATKTTFEGKWMRTNDLVKYDEEGFFYFLNRGDQHVKIKAYYVCASEIENLMMAVPEVLDCAVIFETNHEGFIEASAFVIMDPAHSTTVTQLRGTLLKQHAAHLVPRNFFAVSELPRTQTSKKIKSVKTFESLKNAVGI